MSKIKSLLQTANFPLIFMLLYVTRCIYLGASYQDAIIIAVIASVYCVRHYFIAYFDIKEKVITENDFRKQVIEDMTQVKNEISKVKLMSNPKNPFSR